MTTWQQQADVLAGRAVAAGRPAAWFEELYSAGEAGEHDLPWDRSEPSPLVSAWDAVQQPPHGGRRAVVVGAGLGADARLLLAGGWQVTAFDISPTAVRLAADRSPGVDIRVADLFALPAELVGAFDLVLEVFTVQALPRTERAGATAAVRSLLAPGGRLLVIQRVWDDENDTSGPPWPLSAADIDAFADGDVTLEQQQTVDTAEGPYWRVQFRRA
ncbi:methyltransferase domain-containing protein [Nakamurella sp. YIM 132087]|uniref:Methyltransferase domain-containing protein n=1 Tax=Nakamurella alba TaxID=2665158 RepID=A0A7K1FIS8_9ACTN|nr:methyltransferase [Nakamurella alba]MTD13976.1 methyltransferase domain-containing protein [Nakamurella alba]